MTTHPPQHRIVAVGVGALLAAVAGLAGAAPREPAAPDDRIVEMIEVAGIISPATADFIMQGVTKATERRAHALLLQLDTPGGLDLAMRDIARTFLNADIPIVVYVAPAGARAASAGVIVTLASHVAAMAPGTNIGAAHPVAVGGGQMTKEMEAKVVNDAAAYVEGIAKKRGRNAAWAVDAVRKSVSVTAEEALRLKVIEVVVPDVATLLKQIDGRIVSLPGRTVTLRTASARVLRHEMGLRQKVLSILSNPNIAYILMLLGLAGLYFELSNPGAIFPGVLGGICLILAFFAFQTIPINYAGILLILLAVILFIAELKVVSHGILSIGGIVALTLGSLMLFDFSVPYLRPSYAVLITAIVAISAFVLVVLTLTVKAQVARPKTGAEGLIGEIGTAASRLAPQGKVFLHGEYWNAEAAEPIEEGEAVRVVKWGPGMRVTVERVGRG